MSWPFSSKKDRCDRLLYIDLLFRKTKMYANYLPASILELGDYGDLTKHGDFIRSGNILNDYPILREEVGMGKELVGSNRDYFASRTRKKGTASALTGEIPALAGCSPKLGWDIKKDRHAALVMIDANHHEIAFEGRLHKFIQNKPELADKAFVTKVYHCSAYAQLVTDYGQSGQVYVGYKTSDSTPTFTPAGSASDLGAGAERRWLTSTHPGKWTTGAIQNAPAAYTPLVTLRQITPKEPTLGFRDRLPPEITDDQEMQNYIPPWGELDEQGEEIDD